MTAIDQLGDNWVGIDQREMFRRINSQLGDRWYCTAVSLLGRVKLQLADRQTADWGPRHYEYGDTLDEAVANAATFCNLVTCDSWLAGFQDDDEIDAIGPQQTGPTLFDQEDT